MKKLFLSLAIIFSTAVWSGEIMAQDGGNAANTNNGGGGEADNNKGMGSQTDLDKENKQVTKQQMSPEQKAYEKRMAKAKKERDKKNEITRKRAQKVHDKRLNKAKSGVSNKKKKYVKSHGGK